MNIAKADPELTAKRRKICGGCKFLVKCRVNGIKVRPHDTCSKCTGNPIAIFKTEQLLEECPVGKW